MSRSDAADLRWPLPEDLSDEELERQLFPPSSDAPELGRPLPDWSEVKRELGKKGVTLLLLWREYKERHPDGYGYSRFVDLFAEWESPASKFPANGTDECNIHTIDAFDSRLDDPKQQIDSFFTN